MGSLQKYETQVKTESQKRREYRQQEQERYKAKLSAEETTYKHSSELQRQLLQLEEEWNQSLANYKNKYPTQGEEFERMLRGELPQNWDKIPGATGCTSETCTFRDNYEEFINLKNKAKDEGVIP